MRGEHVNVSRLCVYIEKITNDFFHRERARALYYSSLIESFIRHYVSYPTRKFGQVWWEASYEASFFSYAFFDILLRAEILIH